jgi:hypothetical protein
VHGLRDLETLGLRKAPIAEMQLSDERREQPDNGDIAEREEECPHIGNAEQVDDGIAQNAVMASALPARWIAITSAANGAKFSTALM